MSGKGCTCGWVCGMLGPPSWDLDEGQSRAWQQPGGCGDSHQPWPTTRGWKERRGKWPLAPPPPPWAGAINTARNEPLPMPGVAQSCRGTRHSRARHSNCQWAESLSSPCHAVGGPHGSSSCHRVLGRASTTGCGVRSPAGLTWPPLHVLALCTRRKLWNMKLKDPNSR